MRNLSLSLIFGLIGAAVFGNGLYTGGKALLAQSLMERAWTKTAASGDVHLPWSWMDAYPAARLTLNGEESHIVLNTDSGQALAFGPAIVSGTGGTDTLAIAAHKNTQFKTLKDLKRGDTVKLEQPQTESMSYRITHMEILDSRETGITIEGTAITPSRLALITCYPFDAVSFNGPMRYVVYAERV
jgi:sortase A